MQRQTFEGPSVCYDCIGDVCLTNDVKRQGVSARCAYCREERESLTLEELASRIRDVFEKHFVRYSSPREYDGTQGESPFDVSSGLRRWDRNPRTLYVIIKEMTNIDIPLLDDVLELIHDGQRKYKDVRSGADSSAFRGTLYIERGPDSGAFLKDWNDFVRGIQYHSRFLNREAEIKLKRIFGNISIHKDHSGQRAIRYIDPADESFSIWRARKAHSYEEVETILNFPSAQIGTPPAKSASSGRMNPKGVPVFYGATCPSTCIAEIRPPVGSYAVVGQFKLLKPVRLLDLDVLADIEVQGSYFDPSYSEKKGRAAFFKRLVSEVSRPVMPDDEESEYLKTQVIADYLANIMPPGLHGIIYRSAQTNARGQSLVLFNHASGNLTYTLPSGTRVSASVSYKNRYSEKYWNRLEVTVSHPSYMGTRASLVPGPVFDSYLTELAGEGEPDDRTSSSDDFFLRLDLGSVRVSVIKRVDYSQEPAISTQSPAPAEQIRNILGIANRTENWKTSRYLSRFLMDPGSRISLARQLGEPDGTPAGQIHIELYWKGMRDHVHEVGGRKAVDDEDFAVRYLELFPNLRCAIQDFGRFNDLKDCNYDVSTTDRVAKLVRNLINTEIDIVLESPNFLFIGEAKHLTGFNTRSEYILVHQLVRQYVMARILVDLLGTGKKVVPFVVGNEPAKLRKLKQVDFLVRQRWLREENILKWDDLKYMAP